MTDIERFAQELKKHLHHTLSEFHLDDVVMFLEEAMRDSNCVIMANAKQIAEELKK